MRSGPQIASARLQKSRFQSWAVEFNVVDFKLLLLNLTTQHVFASTFTLTLITEVLL